MRFLVLSAIAAGAAFAIASGPAGAAPAPATARESTVVTLFARASARQAPSMSARPIATLSGQAPLHGGEARFLVTGRRVVDGVRWSRLLLPIRPNGTQGWVRDELLRFATTPLRIVIDQRALRLTLYRSGRPIFRAPVATGKAITPTPVGSFAVAEFVRTRLPRGFLGPVVFPLTAHSRVLNEYAGGRGRVAIHGTSRPALIGSRVSHGCIRMHNRDVLRLARLVRPGTPVRITAP